MTHPIIQPSEPIFHASELVDVPSELAALAHQINQANELYQTGNSDAAARLGRRIAMDATQVIADSFLEVLCFVSDGPFAGRIVAEKGSTQVSRNSIELLNQLLSIIEVESEVAGILARRSSTHVSRFENGFGTANTDYDGVGQHRLDVTLDLPEATGEYLQSPAVQKSRLHDSPALAEMIFVGGSEISR